MIIIFNYFIHKNIINIEKAGYLSNEKYIKCKLWIVMIETLGNVWLLNRLLIMSFYIGV
jgi:hypothetical protein